MSDTKALLARLRQNRANRNEQPQAAQQDLPPDGFDFTTLPDYKQMSMQRAAGDLAGIASPFFRETSDTSGVSIQIDGQEALQFASYDYLGLNQNQEVRSSAAAAAQKWGVSATASRLVGGERPYHPALEQAIADFYGVESALAMVSGHATNVSVIAALVGPKDLVLIDSLIHNSVSDGVRLSGAARLVFPHNDTDWLNWKLTEIRGNYDKVLIVVEGLYSMDGDTPDLKTLVDIKQRHGAWLMVDEAHSIGVLGASGRGISQHCEVDPKAVEIWMGTMSKSLGSSGGFIAGSDALIDFLRFKAAGFVFSVGLSAPLAVAATTALGLINRPLVEKLQENGAYFLAQAKAAGLDVGLSEGAAITPVIIGDSLGAVIAANRLLVRGINALPIIFPAVPEKQARLRFFVTAMHSFADIDRVVTETTAVIKELEDLPDLAAMIASA
ncbi:MAG: aminotransferase class I/II-fold pyridoxal phosphate-dependent enzyme [Rhodobacteraceae bacterium]|nr:aminotransferase class I/II-fold pyridoxal phosphate-dependent enzyme [Paracoccaceae bacterium]